MPVADLHRFPFIVPVQTAASIKKIPKPNKRLRDFPLFIPQPAVSRISLHDITSITTAGLLTLGSIYRQCLPGSTQWRDYCVRPRLQRWARPRFSRSSLFNPFRNCDLICMSVLPIMTPGFLSRFFVLNSSDNRCVLFASGTILSIEHTIAYRSLTKHSSLHFTPTR